MALTYLKLVAMACCWGGTYVAGRILGPQITPFSGAFLRFVVALLALGPYLFATEERPRLNAKLVLLLLAIGATGIAIYNFLFLWGLKSVPAGRTAVIISSNPVFVALASRFLFKDRLGGMGILGILLCLVGAAIAIGHGNPLALFSGQVTPGDLSIIAAMFCWAAFSVLGKFAVGKITPLASVTLACLFGALMLLPPALREGLAAQAARLDLMGWGSIVFLGIFGTALGFVWFYEGIRAIGATRAAVFINITPVSAALLGAVILGERIGRSLVVGGILVLVGVALTNRRSGRAAQAARALPDPVDVP